MEKCDGPEYRRTIIGEAQAASAQRRRGVKDVLSVAEFVRVQASPAACDKTLDRTKPRFI